ncbi:MAG: AbrB/MazE/SpoVT family DNA-binding domain-containing protein [Deinococcota bacterium]
MKLDKFGRVLIPKSMRDKLNVDADQDLQLSIQDGAFVLTPQRSAVLKIVDGLPLLEVEAVVEIEDVNDAIDLVRSERDEQLSGL